MNFYEDLVIGEKVELGSVTFDAASIIRFAKLYDPQYFHIDPERAKTGPFGALCASGWHSASAGMRLIVEWHKRVAAEKTARGEPVPILGPSPGFTDLKWLIPVFAGDRVSYSTEVVGKRLSQSRAGWGLTEHRMTGRNQHGEIVITWVSTAFTPCRPA